MLQKRFQNTYLLLCSRSTLLLKLGRISISVECKSVLLTNDTVEYLPVRRIENPVGLAGGEDERSCEPIMVEHLGADFQQIRKRLYDLPLWTDKGQVETHWRGRL